MSTKLTPLLLAFIGLLCIQCKPDHTSTANKVEIKYGTADQKSEKIANDIMIAMGGNEKWNDLQYISWTFFGNRRLTWDKPGGRVRIENPRDTTVHLVNLNDGTGKYAKNGIEESDPEELKKQLTRAKNIWINDSYWLVMPFKLRDEGVILKYAREDTTSVGTPASVLELTFDNVGSTPNNKYEVYVDNSDNLIKQWDFFKDAAQDTFNRSWPWDNYKDFNGLLISTDRSDKSGPSEVKIYETLPDSVFEKI